MLADTAKSSENKFPQPTPLEGLVLDLQVVLEDLSNSVGMLSNIANSLQELLQFLRAPVSPDCLKEGI